MDALRSEQDGAKVLSAGLLNALAESVILPFRRLDTAALLRIAQARLRDAAARWGTARGVALQLKCFETLAELFVLKQGGEVSPRSLTQRAAEGFLFNWFKPTMPLNPGQQIVITPDMKGEGGYTICRAMLGEDPVLTLFRKQQVLCFLPKSHLEGSILQVNFHSFSLRTVQRAVDMGGSGGLQVELPEVCFADVVGHDAVKRLCMLMAGRAAEMRQFGRAGCNAGAASDLQQATELAIKAVLCWGLDEKVGMLSLARSEQLPDLTTGPVWLLERVRHWLDQAFSEASSILCSHWPLVENVANSLMQFRVLEQSEWQILWNHGVTSVISTT